MSLATGVCGDAWSQSHRSRSFMETICDRACENQPCERKLYRVIFTLISLALNVVSHFRKFQKKAH